MQATGETPVLWRLCATAARGDWHDFERWHAWFRASRESSELLAETLQMGGSLARLLADLDVLDDPARTTLTRIRRSRCLPRTRWQRARWGFRRRTR